MGWVRRSTLVFGLVAYLSVAVAMPAAERRLFAVRPGVSLAGVPIGGWLPRQVNDLIAAIALGAYRPPVPAALDKRTGSVLPAQTGQELDIVATRAAISVAGPGQQVAPVMQRLQPSVDAAALQGLERVMARTPAPTAAGALDNVVLLPRHPFVLALAGQEGCALARSLGSLAAAAGLPTREGDGCRLAVQNTTSGPLVLHVRGGWLELAAPDESGAFTMARGGH